MHPRPIKYPKYLRERKLFDGPFARRARLLEIRRHCFPHLNRYKAPEPWYRRAWDALRTWWWLHLGAGASA